ncbi:MAG: hypothetical protein ACRD3E_01345, partial [Terriglobales bacterium]
FTDQDGNYVFTEVPPADGYAITATAQGKQIAQQTGLAVRVGDEKLLIPPLQEAPPVAEGAAAPEKPTSKPAPVVVANDVTSAVSTVITSKQLEALPVYNRNFLAFGLFTLNSHDVEAGSPLQGATFSISGARPSSNNFLLDGADNVASSSNQAIPFQVNDSVQEFRVTSSNANAEFGRGMGGVVNVVTRRAYTGIHGRMFGYFGKDSLNSDTPLSVYRNSGFAKAASFAGSPAATAAVRPAGTPGSIFQPPLTVADYNTYAATAQANGYCTDSIVNPTGQAPNTCVANGFGRNTIFSPGAVMAGSDSHRQPFTSQQFGGSLGGGLMKDRLFLFSSYEGTRINNPNPIFERVPSSFDKAPPGGIAGLNVASQKIAQGVLSLYPNSNVVGIPGVLEFYKGQAPNYTHVDNLLLRADFKQSEKTDWVLRYSVQNLDQLHDDTLPSNTVYPGNGGYRKALNQNGILTNNHRFARMTNDLRVGASRFQVLDKAQDATFDPTTIGLPAGSMMTFLLSGLDARYSGARKGVTGAMTGWYNAFWNTASSPNAMAPSLDGLFPFARVGAPLGAPGERRDTTVFASDSVTLSWGRHNIKFGGDYRRLENVSNTSGFARGLVISSNIGEFTSDSETCNDPGCPGFTNPSFDYAIRQRSIYGGLFRSYAVAGFVQDAWRLNNSLSLNLGVRYEFSSVPHEDHNQIWNFDPAANGLYQEKGNQIVESYGYSCALGFSRTDSIYAVHSSTNPWNCTNKSTHNGAILPERTHDFAPRIGFVYSLDREAKTVIRGGVGMYYDQLPISTMSQLLFNRPTPLNFPAAQGVYGQNFATSYCGTAQCGLGNNTLFGVPTALQPFASAAVPFALYSRDYDNSKTPYSWQYSGTIQHQIVRQLAVEVGYLGTRSYHLPIVYNSGFQNEWFCTSTPNCDTNSFSPVYTMANIGTAKYDSIMARVRFASWHGMTANASYNWSRSYDNGSQGTFPLLLVSLPVQVFGLQAFGTGNPNFLSFGSRLAGAIPGIDKYPSTGVGTNLSDLLVSGLTTTGAAAVNVSRYDIPQDPTNVLQNEWGPSDFNNSQRVVVDYVWALPLPKDSRLLSNWQVSGVIIGQSGQPFTIFSGPAYGELTQRANVNSVNFTGNPDKWITGSIALPGETCSASQWGSPYVTGATLYGGSPGSPCIGNSGRNQFIGPSYITSNVAIQKSFLVSNDETKQLLIRGEIFNMFNRSNFYNPISAASLDGVTSNPDFGKIMSAHDPRQIQLAIRFVF